MFRASRSPPQAFAAARLAVYNGDMVRTFSLGRLMLGITLVCAICAVAAYYGEDFGDYLLCSALFVPTAVVCLALVSVAKHRKTTLAISISGAFVAAFIFTPAIAHTGYFPMSAWEVIRADYLSLAVFPPLGALTLGGAVLMDEKFGHRETD